MTDEDALWKNALANPDDDTARLVCADCLQEGGSWAMAEALRSPAGKPFVKLTAVAISTARDANRALPTIVAPLADAMERLRQRLETALAPLRAAIARHAADMREG